MIRLEGIRKTYADGTCALGGVDLVLQEGMVGLLGPNGAGKTTLLSILVLVLEPSAGRRIYDGLDARTGRNRQQIRRTIGYLPQDFSPVQALTGRQYLLHCSRLRGLRLGRRDLQRRVDQLLEAVELSAVADRPSGTYSGGMRRRLGVAQALVHSPRLLVVDEPTAGLDPEERTRFRNLISEVAEHTAVLLSTHIVEDIEATCPRIAVIDDGRLLYDGSAGALLRQAEGRLWQVEAGQAIPPSALPVARRVHEGKAVRVLYAETPMAEIAAQPVREVTLELAYAAFSARRGGRRGEL